MKALLSILFIAVSASVHSADCTISASDITSVSWANSTTATIASIYVAELPAECQTEPGECPDCPPCQECPEQPPTEPPESPDVSRIENINWYPQPQVNPSFKIPQEGIVASRFTTTSGEWYYGQVTLAPTTGTGYVTRNMWFSTVAGGPALQQENSRCDISQSEAVIKWSQWDSPRSRMECKLERNTQYYLNYQNVGCNASACDAVRDFQNNNMP